MLLVEDSNEVAAVSADYLEQLGYSVEHAANGSDALRKLQGSQPYALVFSDILMPGSVAGLELARIVREHHSEIPILLVTGYSDKAQEAVHEGFPVIHKPYDLQVCPMPFASFTWIPPADTRIDVKPASRCRDL